MYNLIENMIMGVFSELFRIPKGNGCTGTLFKAHKTPTNTVENFVPAQFISHFPFPIPVS
jgi:hypothetical protein